MDSWFDISINTSFSTFQIGDGPPGGHPHRCFMGRTRKDVDKKLIRILKKEPAYLAALTKQVKCDRKTTKTHLSDLQVNGLVDSIRFSNMTIYHLKDQKPWWKYLKDGKKRTDVFDNYYLKNIDEASKSNYLEGVDRNVDSGMKSARQVGENLVKISELIEEAKELEKQKFCFLFWCW